jgi:hypothetical protein
MLQMMRRLAGAAVLAAIMIAPGAHAIGIDCLPQEAPEYARPKLGSRQSAVVFIHGLHGDGRRTWVATSWGSDIAAWPCLLLADADVFAGSNVFLARYRSAAAQRNPSIGEVAREILGDLNAAKVFEHEHVTIVAHSMGGIVLARLLTDGLLRPDQRERIRLVMFVGTPALPTEAAAICSKFSLNVQCSEMIDADAMARLWQSWDALSPRPPAWCVAEGADMWIPWKTRVVPEASAYRPCHVPEFRSRDDAHDHEDVVKPPSLGERPHRDLRAAFTACVRPHLRSVASLTPAEERLAERAGEWFFGLKQRLVRINDDWTGPLTESTAQVNALWYPAGNAPSFDFARYERRLPNEFVQPLRDLMVELLPRADFAWAQRADRVGLRVPDSAFEGLLQRLRAAGGLRADDVVLALKPRKEFDGQHLLLLRSDSSNSAPGTPAAAFGLLGLLVIPKPVEGCQA